MTVVLAIFAFALAGCGSDAPAEPPDADTSSDGGSSEASDERVSMTGTFRVGGGPTPGIDEPLDGNVTFDGPVTETASAVEGVFTIELSPGDYTVMANPSGFYAAANCPTGSASVEVNQTEPIAVSCVVE